MKPFKISGEVNGTFKSMPVYCKVVALIVHDPNWGADADGNRGIPQDFLEDVTVTEARYTYTDNLLPKEELDDIIFDDNGIEWEEDDGTGPGQPDTLEEKYEGSNRNNVWWTDEN